MNIFSEITVVKRSGQRVNFNGSKIALAIKKSFDNTFREYKLEEVNKVYEDTLNYILNNYKTRKTINVEDIQDIIENILKKDNYIDVYESFRNYRLRRAESRKAFSIKQQHKFVKAIEKIGLINKEKEYLSKNLILFGETISREYTKSYVIDSKYTRAHEEGKIRINNFSYFNLGFLGDIHLDLTKTLENNNFQDLIDCLLLVKDEVRGEIAIDSLDILLENIVLNNYKIILKKTIYKYFNILGFIPLINYKKIEETIDKINNINYDLNIFKNFILNKQIENIFNISHKETMESLKSYIHINIYNLLNSLSKIDKKYCISIGTGKITIIRNEIIKVLNEFDYLDNVTIIYKYKKVEELQDVLSLIINKKNICLNYINKNEVEYFSTGKRIFENDNGENISTGRSIIAETSLNLSRLGLKHSKLNKEFYQELDDLIELIKNQLLFVFETIGDRLKNNYQILFNGNILDDEKLENNQKIRKVIKNGTLNINLVGLKECSVILDKDNCLDIMIKIVKYLNEKVSEFSKQTKLNFTLSSIINEEDKELIILDKTIYGLIENITKKTSYDNIFCIDNLNNIEEKIKYISKYYYLFTGGAKVEIVLTKKGSINYLNELISLLIKYNINYVKIGYKI